MRARRFRPCRSGRLVSALLLAALLAACATAPRDGPVAWSELRGWRAADVAGAWPALLYSCDKLEARSARWRDLCAEARALDPPAQAAARAFFERHFEPWLQRDGRDTEGLITGYYEPLLHGNFAPSERYRYPLYRPPDDLLIVELGDLYPDLRGRRLRGRLQGQRVVPYFSRAEIESERTPLAGHELLWVDDPIGLFFLQIQGSGRVELPSGETVAVGYAEQNGHPYTPIGRTLVERAGIPFDAIDMPTIRQWLDANPERARSVMNSNASYVFFELRDSDLPGPIGSLGVPLLAERAIAVDPAYVPLGLPVWLDTTLPDGAPYRRLVFAQDTGGAIRGPVRADVFFGNGALAEYYAGRMKSPGRLYVLRPKSADSER
jgi:membrane-bound lytic murein transglycosylase A